MIFCRHKWLVIEKHEMESQSETWQKLSITTFTAPHDFYKRKVIIALGCEKCGKLNVIIESSGA